MGKSANKVRLKNRGIGEKIQRWNSSSSEVRLVGSKRKTAAGGGPERKCDCGEKISIKSKQSLCSKCRKTRKYQPPPEYKVVDIKSVERGTSGENSSLSIPVRPSPPRSGHSPTRHSPLGGFVSAAGRRTEEMIKELGIDALSDQELVRALSFLSLVDIIKCSAVCRRWRNICRSDGLWRLLFVRDTPVPEDPFCLHLFPKSKVSAVRYCRWQRRYMMAMQENRQLVTTEGKGRRCSVVYEDSRVSKPPQDDSPIMLDESTGYPCSSDAALEAPSPLRALTSTAIRVMTGSTVGSCRDGSLGSFSQSYSPLSSRMVDQDDFSTQRVCDSPKKGRLLQYGQLLPLLVDMKVVIVGCENCGKSDLVNNFMSLVSSPSDEGTKAVRKQIDVTICHTAEIVVRWQRSLFDLRLHLWDTEDSDMFRAVAPFYYMEADAILVVFALGDSESEKCAGEWYREVRSRVEGKAIINLVSVVGEDGSTSAQRQQASQAFQDVQQDDYYEVDAGSPVAIASLMATVVETVCRSRFRERENQST